MCMNLDITFPTAFGLPKQNLFVLPCLQEWISASGFALTSDLIFLHTEPGSLTQLKRDDVVYVFPPRLNELYKNMHLIKEQDVLLTANEDTSIPSGLVNRIYPQKDPLSDIAVVDLLNYPMLLYWFVQNYEDTLDSEKISHVPFGLNFYFNFGSQGGGGSFGFIIGKTVRPSLYYFSKFKTCEKKSEENLL